MARISSVVLLALMYGPLAGAANQAAGASIERISVGPGGVQGEFESFLRSMSGDGGFVAFDSGSASLVTGDTNGRVDAFVRDVRAGVTRRVSVATGGGQGDQDSSNPQLSGSGRFVAFGSTATNLVPGDTNQFDDVFVRDLATGITRRVSLGSRGNQGNGHSFVDAISYGGRFVVFTSAASNLVPNDTNRAQDIFVRDRRAGTTKRVSLGSSGRQGNGTSRSAAISADGRYVAFGSHASNLVPDDTNGFPDIFVRDRTTNTTTRVNVSSTGRQADLTSVSPAISADGRFVGFWSEATNLVEGDTNATADAFVHDRTTGTTVRVSVGAGGRQGDGPTQELSLSAKGRYAVFSSAASNLVAGDTNGAADVFLHNLRTGTTSRLSVSGAGTQGNSFSVGPAISADGSTVAFSSDASNLVPGDTNARSDVFVRAR